MQLWPGADVIDALFGVGCFGAAGLAMAGHVGPACALYFALQGFAWLAPRDEED
jgi:hypothetical protein